MSRTRFLAAIAVAALLMQLFPKYSDFVKWIAISVGVLYLTGRVLRTYPQEYRLNRRNAAQRAADEQEYRRYTTEVAAIRAKYYSLGAPDPGTPDEMAAGSEDCASELTALHERHRSMLERKFGPG